MWTSRTFNSVQVNCCQGILKFRNKVVFRCQSSLLYLSHFIRGLERLVLLSWQWRNCARAHVELTMLLFHSLKRTLPSLRNTLSPDHDITWSTRLRLNGCGSETDFRRQQRGLTRCTRVWLATESRASIDSAPSSAACRVERRRAPRTACSVWQTVEKCNSTERLPARNGLL